MLKILKILIPLLSVFFSDVSLAGYSRGQEDHIRRISKNIYFNNSDKLLAEGAESGRMHWRSEGGKLILVSVSGDKTSSNVLHNMFDRFDHKNFGFQDMNYQIDFRVLSTIHQYRSGIKLYEVKRTNDSISYRVTFSVFDRCADRFKTGSYSRDRWTNYLQAAGSIAGVLGMGRLILPAKSCNYNSNSRKIN